MAKKARRRNPEGRYLIFFHKLEESNLGPEYDYKGRCSDLEIFELHLEYQKFGLKPRQECELLAFEDEGGEYDRYSKPKQEPVARWHLFVNRHGDVQVQRVEGSDGDE